MVASHRSSESMKKSLRQNMVNYILEFHSEKYDNLINNMKKLENKLSEFML